MIDWIAVIIGTGIFAALLKINHQLGCIKVEIKNLVSTTTDHEQRIRELEKSK